MNAPLQWRKWNSAEMTRSRTKLPSAQIPSGFPKPWERRSHTLIVNRHDLEVKDVLVTMATFGATATMQSICHS